MRRRISTVLMAGILTATGAAVVVLPAGCQSANQTAATTEPSTACPICHRETRVQPLTGLEYTTCICPTCETVSTLDKNLLLSFERFDGTPRSETVHVCAQDRTVVMECAVCREARQARQARRE